VRDVEFIFQIMSTMIKIISQTNSRGKKRFFKLTKYKHPQEKIEKEPAPFALELAKWNISCMASMSLER